MWRVRRPAGGPVTGTGSLRGSSFRLPCKRTTASSRLNSLSLRHRPPQHPPYNLSLPFSPTLLPLLSLFFCLSSLSADPPLTSFSIRPDARLRTCASLVSSRSSDRPAGRPLLSLHHHISRLLSSFARKRCHTRETRPTAFFVLRSSLLLSRTPMRCSSLAYTILPLAFNSHPPSPPFFLSFSPLAAEVMPRIRFFILPPLFPLSPGCPAAVVSFSSFSL